MKNRVCQRRSRIVSILISIATISLSSNAWAGNNRSFFFGDEAAMTGGAIVTGFSGAGGLYYNPSLVVGKEHDQLHLSGTMFMFRIRNVDDAVNISTVDGTHPQDISTTTFFIVPTAFVIMKNLTPNLSAGFGNFTTHNNQTSVHTLVSTPLDTYEGVDPGSEITSSVDFMEQNVTHHMGPAFALKINEHLKLGVAFFLDYSTDSLRSSTRAELDAAASGDRVEGFDYEEVRYDVTSFDLQIVIGASLSFAHWHGGLTVRTPEFAVFQMGTTVTVNESATFADSTPDVDSADADYKYNKWKGWSFIAHKPPEVSLALSYKADKFQVGAEGAVLPPIQGDANNPGTPLAWNVAVGGLYQLTQKLLIGAGLFTDRHLNKSPRFMGDGQINYYGLSLGARISKPFRVLSATTGNDRNKSIPLMFTSTYAFRYALGIGKIGTMDFDAVNWNHALSTTGVYFHEISFHMGSGLDF